MDPNFSWNKRVSGSNNQKIVSDLAVSDFITSSNVHKSYPLSNYPYSIYQTAWELPFLDVDEDKGLRYKLRNLWWWQPDQESIPAQFLEASSMHGLKYVSQPKRHILERLVKYLASSSLLKMFHNAPFNLIYKIFCTGYSG